jgi:hypothetical protein
MSFGHHMNLAMACGEVATAINGLLHFLEGANEAYVAAIRTHYEIYRTASDGHFKRAEEILSTGDPQAVQLLGKLVVKEDRPEPVEIESNSLKGNMNKLFRYHEVAGDTLSTVKPNEPNEGRKGNPQGTE